MRFVKNIIKKPKYVASLDKNHMIVRDFLRDICGGFEDHAEGGYVCYAANLRGYRAWAVDTSRLGGLFLDWIIGVEQESCWVEIKTPEAYATKDHGLRPGERWTLDNLPARKEIATTADDVIHIFEMLMRRHEARNMV